LSAGACLLGAALLAGSVGLATPAAGQTPGVWIRIDDSTSVALPVTDEQGFGAVPVSALTHIGWAVRVVNDTVRLEPNGVALPEVRVVPGTPLVKWGSDVVHIAHAPYWARGQVYVPVQVVVDLLPTRVPAMGFDPLTRTLAPRVALRPPAPRPVRRRRGPYLVVIDAGHGGRDPGTVGARGVREKDVALSLAHAIQGELAHDSAFQVLLTRDRDVLIPIWRRGEQATTWKGDRPAVFVSLHANALPGEANTRGFETYILSEARTDHARRTAALENQAGQSGPQPVSTPSDGALAGILSDLGNVGHQPWSLMLAETIQEELGAVHTGRNRGVLQAPLAVLTNALMPAVLVEFGYLTNARDEALLRSPAFHADAARAIAAALRRFFERYPPGEGP